MQVSSGKINNANNTWLTMLFYNWIGLLAPYTFKCIPECVIVFFLILITYDLFCVDTRTTSNPEARGVSGSDDHHTSVRRRAPHQPAHSVGKHAGTTAGTGERLVKRE